jgi:hypothetical protein
MVETGIWPNPWPERAGVTTIRIDYKTLGDAGLVILDDPFRESLEVGNVLYHYDFHFEQAPPETRPDVAFAFIGMTKHFATRRPGFKHLKPVELEAEFADLRRRSDEAAAHIHGKDHGEMVIRQWREGNWLHGVAIPTRNEQRAAVINEVFMVASALIVMLRDRSIERVEVEPSKLRKLGIGRSQSEPNKPHREIALYVPKRIYNADGTTSHASPYAHPRSGHWKMQPYGKGRALRKRIYIETYWVNLAPGEDPGNGPPRRYKLRWGTGLQGA